MISHPANLPHGHGRQPRFTVVLCTRNPRQDYLLRTLAALAAQTLDAASWNLLVVDSCSSPPLADASIPWPVTHRIVRVDEPGVARARAAGIDQADGEWLVFVDDDNLLDPDYLETCGRIIETQLGIALFCGRISGEYEAPPPSWIKPFLRQLAIIDFPTDTLARCWDPQRVPCWTAGMCIRRDLARDHIDHIRTDAFAMSFRTRVEDVYLVKRLVENGHLAGLFRALHLRHLIPKERLTADYLCKITAETAYNVTRLSLRATGPSWRHFARPMLKWMKASVRHGLSQTGRIKRTAALADLRAAYQSFGASSRGDFAGDSIAAAAEPPSV